MFEIQLKKFQAFKEAERKKVYCREKKREKETDLEMTQMIELEVITTIFHILNKIKESISILRRDTEDI